MPHGKTEVGDLRVGQPHLSVAADVDACLAWLLEQGCKPGDVILYGQSVGSGPTINLAARTPGLAGVVLHSALLSGAPRQGHSHRHAAGRVRTSLQLTSRLVLPWQRGPQCTRIMTRCTLFSPASAVQGCTCSGAAAEQVKVRRDGSLAVHVQACK